MDIDSLTVGQAKELARLFSGVNESPGVIHIGGIDDFCIHKTVIVRTYSAGVWAGTLLEKRKDEVILGRARRMWRWWCAKSISLSAVAVHGINQEKSRIAGPVEKVWLMPIEIIPFFSSFAEASVMESPHAVAE